jgi:putative transcriptional regulator
MTFGLWLRRWRQALDLSRPELAQQVGCSRPMIRQIETDINRPSAMLAVRLAQALGVPLDAQGRVVACARGQLSPAVLPLPSLTVAMAAPLPSSGYMPHLATARAAHGGSPALVLVLPRRVRPGPLLARACPDSGARQ